MQQSEQRTTEPTIAVESVPVNLLVADVNHIQEFVEVHTLNGARRTNPYLEAGYKLLGIYQEAEPLETETKQVVVRKRIVFVVARTAGVAHFEPVQEKRETDKRAKRPVSLPSNLAPAD